MQMNGVKEMTRKEAMLGGQTIVLETGRIAKQANGSVIVRAGDTVVVVTAVASKQPREDMDFLPLMVDYQEMFYAAGKIPGSYFRREIGRPSEKEVLTSRCIDRPIRPLFPANYHHDTQIIATVLSIDPEIDPDVLAITGASAALSISDIPFNGPIAGVRVGKVNGQLIINPTKTQLAESELNIIVAGSKNAVVMVEGGAAVLPEEDIMEAIFFAHREMQPLITLQEELAKELGKPKFELASEKELPEPLQAALHEYESAMRQVITTPDKQQRGKLKDAIEQEFFTRFASELTGYEKVFKTALKEMEKNMMRSMIVKEKRRIDGRKFDEIRPISCSIGELPRTHGSAVFTRGETQVLAVATLGSADDEQRIDAIGGEFFKHFMLHYNFPPFCVGEVRPLRGPARRDIGHGALAERGIAAVIPPPEDFVYTIRVVSEVMESNGSSSMATVCGATLALMDAGVPIRDMVAGVAMGLIKEGDEVIILSDILGDEDHLGDMDFKVVGTHEGVTSIQMDIKISGLTPEIMQKAMLQAREGRKFILGKMKEVISTPKTELSQYAPKVFSIQINPEKIKDLIGPGGKNIKAVVAASGAKVDVDNAGKVKVFASSGDSAQKAIQMIKQLTAEPEVGVIYDGVVKKIMEFGAFVEIMPGTDGLLHISQIDTKRVNSVQDYLKEGDTVRVKVIEIDKQGKIKLSRKVLLEEKQ